MLVALAAVALPGHAGGATSRASGSASRCRCCADDQRVERRRRRRPARRAGTVPVSVAMTPVQCGMLARPSSVDVEAGQHADVLGDAGRAPRARAAGRSPAPSFAGAQRSGFMPQPQNQVPKRTRQRRRRRRARCRCRSGRSRAAAARRDTAAPPSMPRSTVRLVESCASRCSSRLRVAAVRPRRALQPRSPRAGRTWCGTRR